MESQTTEFKPVVTSSIIFVNVAVHIILNFILLIPFDFFYIQDLYLNFGLNPTDFWNGAWWQPITCMFLHGDPGNFMFSIMHLFVNMTALWSLGMPLERTIGSRRYAWLYFVSGASSSLFVILSSLISPLHETQITVGASGAVLGILGGMAIFYPNSRVLVFFIPMKLRTAAISFVVLSILAEVFGFFQVVSHMGHLGGVLGGILYTRFVIGTEIGFSEIHQRAPIQRSIMKIMINRQRPDSFFHDTKIPEKEINPLADDNRKKSSHTPESSQGEVPGGKLYYDPETGQFYIKE